MLKHKEIKELTDEAVKGILEKQSSPGINTGFKDLDHLTGGFEAGELIMCCGRPAMGKTGFAISLIRNVCIEGGKTCLYFSLEKSDVFFVKHLIKTLAIMPDKDPENITPDERDRVLELSETIGESNLIVESGKYTVEDITAACNEHAELKRPDLIIVDYLQMIELADNKASKRGYACIVRELKNLAIKMQCPILLLSKIGRNVEKRKNHIPVLDDLRKYGNIAECADKILFLYRDEYYDIDTKGKGLAMLILAKNYNGKVGSVELVHIGRGLLVSKK